MGKRTEKRATALGRRLIAWREEVGRRDRLKGPLPLAEAARRIGIARQTLVDFENGSRFPTHQETQKLIYAATGISPADWWEAA